MRISNHIILLVSGMISGTLACAARDSDAVDYLNDSVPSGWIYESVFNQSLPCDDEWWHSFADPMLDSLIDMGVSNNYNLAIAGHRIEVARNTMKGARSQYFPSFGLTADWTKGRNSGLTGNIAADATGYSYWSLGVDMSWEIDLFGKITSDVKQKKSLYKASQAEYAGAMVALCSNIASTYFTLRMYQAERLVAEEHTESQLKVVKLTEARFETGLVSMLDVTQAREVYYSTMASIPVLENSIHTTINALAILLGVYPADIERTLAPARPLPDYNQIVSTGIPMELLRRRPDIVQAEMELTSVAQSVGIAKKDFLPSLSINGSIGTVSHRAGDLFDNRSLTYSVTPTLSWTIFDGLSRKYNLASARQQLEISMDSYNLAVMTAVEEVDNAMSSYISSLRHIDAIRLMLEQNRKSLKLSVDLYKGGLTPFSNVVDAQLNVLSSQNALIVAHGNALTSLVSLYKALGGGWNGL